MQIDALESAKRKLERKLSALAAKSSALKEANAAQAVTLEGLQVDLLHPQSLYVCIWHPSSACHTHRVHGHYLEEASGHASPPQCAASRCNVRFPQESRGDALRQHGH